MIAPCMMVLVISYYYLMRTRRTLNTLPNHSKVLPASMWRAIWYPKLFDVSDKNATTYVQRRRWASTLPRESNNIASESLTKIVVVPALHTKGRVLKCVAVI